MNPVSAIYGSVVGARNLLYDRGVLPARSLRGPVVSIGNLSVGGSVERGVELPDVLECD